MGVTQRVVIARHRGGWNSAASFWKVLLSPGVIKQCPPFRVLPLSAAFCYCQPRRPSTEYRWNHCKVEPWREMFFGFHCVIGGGKNSLKTWNVIRSWMWSQLEKLRRRAVPYTRISQLLSFHEWWVYFPESSTRNPLAIAQGCQKSQILHSHHRLWWSPKSSIPRCEYCSLVPFPPYWTDKASCLGSLTQESLQIPSGQHASSHHHLKATLLPHRCPLREQLCPPLLSWLEESLFLP